MEQKIVMSPISETTDEYMGTYKELYEDSD